MLVNFLLTINEYRIDRRSRPNNQPTYSSSMPIENNQDIYKDIRLPQEDAEILSKNMDLSRPTVMLDEKRYKDSKDNHGIGGYKYVSAKHQKSQDEIVPQSPERGRSECNLS